jgi:hypothetical protein
MHVLLCMGLPVILTASSSNPTSAVQPIIDVAVVPWWVDQLVVLELVNWLAELSLTVGNFTLGSEVRDYRDCCLEHRKEPDPDFKIAPQLGTIVVAEDLLHRL